MLIHRWSQVQVDDEAGPGPDCLAANERRRAPASVRLALRAAERACALAGVDPATTASVFASEHGDLAIVDALCRTLAGDPALLSPMRFHHSVHNAASGYWSIATGCRAPGTALAAGAQSFAAALLEAAAQVCADDRPVLLVHVDTAPVGPLASVVSPRTAGAQALVLGPRAQPGSRALALALRPAANAAPVSAQAALSAFCDEASTALELPLHAHLSLAVTLT